MEKERYIESCMKLVELVGDMTYSQWCKIRKLIEDEYQKGQAKEPLGKVEHLDLLMKQSYIDRK